MRQMGMHNKMTRSLALKNPAYYPKTIYSPRAGEKGVIYDEDVKVKKTGLIHNQNTIDSNADSNIHRFVDKKLNYS